MGDLTYGLRLLRRNPAMAAAATITLALGIAATSAAVTIANAVLVRRLPYFESDRIVSVGEYDRARERTSGNVSWPDFLDYGRQTETVEHLSGYNGGSRALEIPGSLAERVPVVMVTSEFFEALGVRALRGRTFQAADTTQGSPLVVLITHGCWQNRFGGDPSVVGRRIAIEGAPADVVGVLPADFEFPPRGLAELWLPLRPRQAQLERRYFHWMNALGRLKPGVTVAQASSELDAISRRIAVQDPGHATTGARAIALQDEIVASAKPVLLMVTGAAGLLLLVACANLACLLLARGQTRAIEMGVRSALGASRARLARQVMAENLVLALPGGVLGVLAGGWLVRLFVVALPRGERVRLPHVQELGLDATTVALGAAVVIGAVFAFGILPALRTSRAASVLNLRGVAGSGRRDIRLQGVFIAAQVTVALVLLFGAGLLGRSVWRVLDVSPGFRTDRLLIATVAITGPRYPTRDAVAAFHARTLAAVAAIPGVTGAASIDQPPLTGPGNSGAFTIDGAAEPRENTVLVRTVASNYFDVMGIPLLSGRRFEPTDRLGGPPVVLVNRLLADVVFGGRAIGQRVRFPFTGPAPLEIVGVVDNEQFADIDQPVRPVLYFPYDQGPTGVMSLVLRTATEPGPIAPSLRAAMALLDPGLPLYAVATMDEILGSSSPVFRRRSVLFILGGFAGAALLLAAVGLYGVLAQIVASRTREIGIRLALGASARAIVGAVLRPGLLAVGAGLAMGVAGCLLAGRLLGSLLFRTASVDPSALAAVVALLVLAALAASIAPSRRALGVDPVESLRE